jgi:hypothetical protein
VESAAGERPGSDTSIKPAPYDQDVVHPASHADILNGALNDYLGRDNVRVID